MKRKKQKHQKQSPIKGGTPRAPRRKRSRREVLSLLKFGAAGVALLGGGGWYLVSTVRAELHETDLSRVGVGIPAIVQIHDPQCPSCTALQREARAAVAEFAEDEILFLVANIAQSDGRRFAAGFGAGPVTLLLFDGQGRMRRMLRGTNSKEVLVQEFRRHLQTTG